MGRAGPARPARLHNSGRVNDLAGSHSHSPDAIRQPHDADLAPQAQARRRRQLELELGRAPGCSSMAQVKLALVAAALLALLAVSLAVPAKHHRDDGHAASDSSADSSDSSDSSSSESGEEHNRKRQQQPARNVPVSNPQDPQDQQEEQFAGQPMGNAIPFEQKESDVVPPFPKPVRRNNKKGDVLEQKMEPGQPWESHYKHGVAPAKLPAQETDNAHSYRHSIIHPYGDDLHA